MLSRRRFLTAAGATLVLGTQAGAASATDDPIDVFVVGGQSNAKGHGTASKSPDPPSGTAYEFDNDNDDIVELDDPVGTGRSGAESGSAWPAFAKVYASRTGHKSAYVPTAVGGAAQVAAAHPSKNWDSGGDLRSRAVRILNQAMKALRKSGYRPKLRGMLWSQGERDAQKIDAGDITIKEYKQAFSDMLGYFSNTIRKYFPFWLFQTGQPRNGDTKGFQKIRSAQTKFPANQRDVQMVSTIQKNFPENDDRPHTRTNNLHYSQDGYNKMGRTGAKNLGPMRVRPGDLFPADPDKDGRYEDINGDGDTNVVDVQRLFANRDSERVQNAAGYDFNTNNKIDVVDVQRLFAEITN